MLVLTAFLAVLVVSASIIFFVSGKKTDANEGLFLALAIIPIGLVATFVMSAFGAFFVDVKNESSIDMTSPLGTHGNGEYFIQDDGDYRIVVDTDLGLEMFSVDASDARVVYTDEEPRVDYKCDDGYVPRWITYPLVWGEKGPECNGLGYDSDVILYLPAEVRP